MRSLFIEKNKNKFLLSILLLAVAVRLWVFPFVFLNGGVTLLGADSYYHARRILATVAHFPSALSFDSYINFPYGSSIGWAPLYDQFIALIALIIGMGKPGLYTIEVTAALVPLLLGVLTVWLVFLIAEKLFDWRVGLISAGIFAITPAHVYVSFLGYADHHVAETLLSTAAYLFFIMALKNAQKINISFSNFRNNLLKNSVLPALTGITLSLSIFTWNGAPIFVGLIGLYIPIQFVIDRKFGRNSDYLILTGSIAFLVSLLIITPIAISQDTGFDYNSSLPSLFHVGFLAVFFFLCVLLGLMQYMRYKKWWYNPLLLIMVFFASVFSLQTFYPEFYQSASNGLNYLYGEGILSTIQEAVPLFKSQAGLFTLENVWRAFTLSFYLAVLSLVYYIYKTARTKYSNEAVFLIVWTLIVLALTVLQKRFIYLLAVNVAIFSGYFITIVLERPAPEQSTAKKLKRQKKNQSASGFLPILAIILVLLMAVPNILVVKSMATTEIAAPDADIRESFKWLRDNSAPTSYYDTPDKPAEYGVMSWWDYGNWILYISRRPVVANNFQTGIDDAAHFLTEPDEQAANGILDKRKVRFIITDAQMLKLKFSSIAMLAGKNAADYYGTSDDAPIRSVNAENKKFFAAMLSRLHVFDGDGLVHYRLIYESNTTAIRSPDIKYIKIFEYVPGAIISGKANDGDIKIT
ncbi:MAG: oligosaccharyl transferase, archaeosortase A system-associated, partial [Candidatus Methanoperedens sp.]